MSNAAKLVPIRVGDWMVVHRMVGRVVRVRRAGTVDVRCPDGNHYRVSGLAVDETGRACRMEAA